MKAAFSKINITPELPVRLSGFGVNRVAHEILDPVCARIHYFKGHEELLWIQFDLCGVDNELIDKFVDTLLDDLNTSNAQTVVFEVTKLLNQSLRGKDFNLLAKYYNTLKECVGILGLVFNERELSLEDKELFNKWNEFKANKDFNSADEVRKILMERNLL